MGDIDFFSWEIQLDNKNMVGGDNSSVTSSHLGQWHRLFDYVKKKGSFFPRKKIQIFNQPSIFMAEHCNQI